MLEQSVYGNTIFEWLIAAGFALVAGAALVALRALILHRLSTRDPKAQRHAAASMRAVFEGTRPWFLIMVAAFIGAQIVELPRKADRLVDHVTIIAAIAPTAGWAGLAIRHWLARPGAAQRAAGAGAATTGAVLVFFAPLALWAVVGVLSPASI